jgi:DNA-binding response OmpR family regulator
MALTLVLSAGLDAELFSTRNFILQAAGYYVVPAYSVNEAMKYFEGGDFDLILLCQSIPTKDRDWLTSSIRASGSRIPVVSVAGKLIEDDHFAGITVGSYPEELLTGIGDVLVNAAPLAVLTRVSLIKKDVGVLPPKGAVAA